MRNKFRGHYRPSDAEFESLWKEAIFVPDANVLLSVYRYSRTTSDQLLDVLAQLNRIWLPYQFAEEYHRHRIAIIVEQANAYRDAASRIRVQLEEEFRSKKRHPFVSAEALDAMENCATNSVKASVNFKSCSRTIFT